MFRFLAKGLLRDRSRSFFPLLIITAGVMLTMVLQSWMNGFSVMTIRDNARFQTGHVKIVTKAYEKAIDQRPIDLGFLNITEMTEKLIAEFPEMAWLPRIYFGGLLDLPDEAGETNTQGEIFCVAVDLSADSKEIEILNLQNALKQGRLPENQNEILISEQVADKMEIHLEDKITVFTSTMYGSMTMQNFIVCGTVRFGIHALDRGAAIIDIKAAQMMLDMEDAASEILGFFPRYNEAASYQISAEFNENFSSDNDEYSPVMLPLREQEDLDFLLKALDDRVVLIIVVFVFIMSLVLWNAGLMNGIRRYGEISVRLAMGENKIRIYSSLIAESSLLGVVGSVIGTILGLAISYYIQEYGIEMGDLMRDASMIMSSRMTAQITSATFYIGFIPGLLASVSGAVFSGIGIFKRKTAQLFKELEI